MWKNAIRAFLIGISYHSLKKIIAKLPPAYRPYATLVLRGAVFFMLFLTIFAFLSGRVTVIDQNMQTPNLIVNILLGISFVVSLLVSFLLTAIVEETYRKVSEIGKGMSDAVQTPAKAVERSIETTKSLLARATVAVGEATKSLYETSTKVTGKSVDKAGELAQKWVRKKNKEQGGPSAPSPNGEV